MGSQWSSQELDASVTSKQWICPVCRQVFKAPQLLGGHIRRHHREYRKKSTGSSTQPTNQEMNAKVSQGMSLQSVDLSQGIQSPFLAKPVVPDSSGSSVTQSGSTPHADSRIEYRMEKMERRIGELEMNTMKGDDIIRSFLLCKACDEWLCCRCGKDVVEYFERKDPETNENINGYICPTCHHEVLLQIT